MFKLLQIPKDTMTNLSQRVGYMPKKNCNGCGSGWNKNLVPDTIFFLNITPICCRHDDRYEFGGTEDDKELADEEFFDNLILAVESVNRWYYPTKWARNRCMTYYSFVKDHGESAFDFKLKEI